MQYTRYSKYIVPVQMFLDVLAIIILLLFYIRKQYDIFLVTYTDLSNSWKTIIYNHYKAVFLLIFIWFLISGFSKLYTVSRKSFAYDIFKKIVIQIFLFAISVFAISGVKTHDLLSLKLGLYFVLSLMAFVIFIRFGLFFILKFYRISGKNFRKITLIDYNKNTHQLIDLLQYRKDLGLQLAHIIANKNHNFNGKFLNIENLNFYQYFIENKIQKIFISQNGKLASKSINEIIEIAENLSIDVAFIPDSFFENNSNLSVDYYETIPILTYQRFPLDNLYNSLLKRLFDVSFSLFVIIFIFSWMFPIIVIVTIIDSGFPIFFKQKRNGFKGTEFNCYKFRTMVKNKYENIKITEKNDDRITRFGKFLRKTSLDEMPQYINVLFGDMSVVGPRPHMISQDEYYAEIIHKYTFRHNVKPGITGLAQVSGHRGPINSNKDMEIRIRSDIYYIRNWSFFLDIFIIIKTVFKIIVGDKNAF